MQYDGARIRLLQVLVRTLDFDKNVLVFKGANYLSFVFRSGKKEVD